ncbi:DUF5343 domain-containing protein [Chryseolinea sp. H1M3-3]|uniref:DUF5343 domain-containing protein n=1 Tax=Chryseolinea sp. H1M3-3 TaxID=3034144 RepID=UPI0023ED87C1|nr:DUF5343 domain-containing protein [Chryseolinea sp. H1M3-3]
MAAEIPYMSAPGSISKILEKIREAATPESFSQDFLSTKLGFNGGNYLTFISWAKKCGLLNSDGSPTQLYKQFRNPATSSHSLGKALRIGYAELYSRNEYCHDLDKKGFKGLVMEATGEAHDSAKVDRIVSTFFNAKTLATFDGSPEVKKEDNKDDSKPNKEETQIHALSHSRGKTSIGLNYTINLVLPKTDDPAIYNAIFKSLKENLLND